MRHDYLVQRKWNTVLEDEIQNYKLLWLKIIFSHTPSLTSQTLNIEMITKYL